uniref:Uncharacterized protein n=1 Tax=Anguilla anguilla TaxID=7936 RepID=A0A0E9UKS1_ANGAN
MSIPIAVNALFVLIAMII